MPALSWRIGANLDDFKRQMNETSSLAKSAARKVAQHFLDVNKDLASGAATAAFSGAASGALKLAGRIALVVGAAKLMGDAIGAARQQLADMVELQNKSQNVGVSAGFFQSFTAEARKLQVGVHEQRGAAFGPCPISYTDMLSLARISGEAIRPWEAEIIRALDRTYLEAVNKAEKPAEVSSRPMSVALFDAVFQ